MNSGHAADWLRADDASFQSVADLREPRADFVPTVCTAVMIKTAMSEAISAYSIAVAPDSSWAKFFIDLNTGLLLLQTLIGGQLVLPARLEPTYPYQLSLKLILIFTNDCFGKVQSTTRLRLASIHES
jgi:hypothetical protein